MAHSPIQLGAFQLRRPIGKGGQGAVWEGVHRLTGLPVAVKVLSTLRARDDHARAAFRREVRAAAGLDHPNVIHVLDQGEVDEAAQQSSNGALPAGSPWLAMELAGSSLGDLDGPASWADSRAILTAILRALAHAHARGVVHRDLKPHNLLFMGQARTPAHLAQARLADFGLAFSSGDGLDPGRRVMAGTPLYMAPEQFGGPLIELGPWTDLYAVGWVAWELAAGEHPLKGREMAEIRGRKCGGTLPFWPDFVAAPVGFDAWVMRLLELDPRQRYGAAADALAGLEALPDEAPAPRRRAAAPTMDVGTSSTTMDLLDPLPEHAPGPPTGATATHSDTTWNLDAVAESEVPTSPVWAPPPEITPAPAAPAPMPTAWRSARPERRPALQGAGLGLLDLRTPPLLGRDAECDALWAALRRARDTRTPQLVQLEGGAGQGKTRLLSWLRERARETGAARAAEISAGPRAELPGLRGALVRHFRLHGLAPEVARDLLIRRLIDLGLTEPVDWRPLADVAGLPNPAPAERAERHAALGRLTHALTRERPLLLTLDDAPFAADALAWLRTLQAQPDLPVLVVLAARDEDLGEQAEAREALAALEPERLRLGSLDPDALGSVIRSLLRLDDSLVRALVDRTAGNPAFALQLLADWSDRGLLVPESGGFGLRPGASLALPDDLHAAWSARLERLVARSAPGARDTIELAATLGMAVEHGAWEAVCAHAGAPFLPALAEHMLDQALAVPGQDPSAGWAFGHGMLRESVLRGAAEGGRLQGHHAACAAVLDQRGAPHGVVGRHLARAGDAAAALPRLLAGARQHIDRDAPLAARELVEEAARAADHMGLPPEHPTRARIDLLDCIVELRLGRFSAARARIEALLTRAPLDPDVHLEARCRLAFVAKGLLDLRTALEEGQATLDALGAAPDAIPPVLRDRLILMLGEASVDAGDVPGATRWFDRLDGELAEADQGELLARLHMGRVMVARAQGDLDRAVSEADRAIALYTQLGRRRRLAQVLNTKGDLLRYQADLEAATGAYARAERLFATMGTAYATVPRINRGLTLLALERFSEAGEVLRHTLGEVRAQGHSGYAYAVHHAMLPVVAAKRDGAAFRGHLAAITALRDKGHFVDPDLAVVAEQAGDLWHRAWDRAYASRAWNLARVQWEGLKREDDLRRLRRKLRR